MLKAAIVGVSLLLAQAAPSLSMETGSETSQRTGVLTESKVAQLKARLRLTAEQEPLWQPVEAALRAHARARSSVSEVYSVMGTAMPLIQTLSFGQKRSAASFARSLGITNVASLF